MDVFGEMDRCVLEVPMQDCAQYVLQGQSFPKSETFTTFMDLKDFGNQVSALKKFWITSLESLDLSYLNCIWNQWEHDAVCGEIEIRYKKVVGNGSLVQQ